MTRISLIIILTLSLSVNEVYLQEINDAKCDAQLLHLNYALKARERWAIDCEQLSALVVEYLIMLFLL